MQKVKLQSTSTVTTPNNNNNNNSQTNSSVSKSGHSPKRTDAQDVQTTVELNPAPQKKQKTVAPRSESNRSPPADVHRVVSVTSTINSTTNEPADEPSTSPQSIARTAEDIFEDIDNLIDATMGKATPQLNETDTITENHTTTDDYTPLLLKSRQDCLKVVKVRTQYVLAHEKKPRCMVADTNNNLMVTCGFDGTVRFWSIKRNTTDNVPTLDEIFYSDRESLHLEANQFINSLAFDCQAGRKQRLALAVAFDQASSQQLILYKNVDMIQSNHQAVRTQFVNLAPHSATIKSTCFLKEPQDVVITAGADKKIVCQVVLYF